MESFLEVIEEKWSLDLMMPEFTEELFIIVCTWFSTRTAVGVCSAK